MNSISIHEEFLTHQMWQTVTSNDSVKKRKQNQTKATATNLPYNWSLLEDACDMNHYFEN